MITLSLEEIKARFPHPTNIWNGKYHDHTCYCVGGALNLSLPHNNGDGFPSYGLVSCVLRVYNHTLPKHRAVAYAKGLCRANDQGDYGTAWDIAERAITFKGDYDAIID